jgi:uncharacterized protein YfiM (DUF2279 family)
MKKLIAAMVAGFVLSLPSASAQGIQQDKAQHIGACFATELVLSEVKPFKKWKPWQRILFTTAVIGGAKEWYDHKHPGSHSAEWGDIGADFVGAASAEGVVWLIHRNF